MGGARLPGNRPTAGISGLVQEIYIGMPVMGFRYDQAFFRRAIAFAREIKTGMTQPLKHGRPFGGFQGDTICPGETGGYKTNVMGSSGHSFTHKT